MPMTKISLAFTRTSTLQPCSIRKYRASTQRRQTLELFTDEKIKTPGNEAFKYLNSVGA